MPATALIRDSRTTIKSDEMYTDIVNAVKEAAGLVGIKKIIPSGTAIQNARTTFIGDHMNRDAIIWT